MKAIKYYIVIFIFILAAVSCFFLNAKIMANADETYYDNIYYESSYWKDPNNYTFAFIEENSDYTYTIVSRHRFDTIYPTIDFYKEFCYDADMKIAVSGTDNQGRPYTLFRRISPFVTSYCSNKHTEATATVEAFTFGFNSTVDGVAAGASLGISHKSLYSISYAAKYSVAYDGFVSNISGIYRIEYKHKLRHYVLDKFTAQYRNVEVAYQDGKKTRYRTETQFLGWRRDSTQSVYLFEEGVEKFDLVKVDDLPVYA